MCGPAGEIPPDPDFAVGVSLKLENKGDRIMKAALGLMLAMIGGVVIGAS
jgi:hypothetical protein